MEKIILSCISLLILFGCAGNTVHMSKTHVEEIIFNEDSFTYKDLSFLSEIDQREPFYVIGQDGYYYYIYQCNLYFMYKTQYLYKFRTYKDFKEAVITGKFAPYFFSKKDFDRESLPKNYEERFRLDKKVYDYYLRNGSDAIIKKYLIRDKGRRVYLFKKNYKQDRIMTIAYCMWLCCRSKYFPGGYVGEKYIIPQKVDD